MKKKGSKNKLLAYDFHFTSMSLKEIAAGHKVSQARISLASKQYPTEYFKSRKDAYKSDCLFIVSEVDIERVLYLMNEYKIPYSIPQNYELNVKFESKINN